MIYKYNFCAITLALVCVISTAAMEIKRSRRMAAFNFSKPNQDIDWGKDTVTVPTLSAAPLGDQFWAKMAKGTSNPPITKQPGDLVTNQPGKNPTDKPGTSPDNILTSFPNAQPGKNHADQPDVLSDNLAGNLPADQSKTVATTVDYRDDCPIYENFCIYVNRCNPSQHCYMNLDCTQYRCVNNTIEASSPRVLGNAYKGYRSDCPEEEDFCRDPGQCMTHQLCYMNMDCTNSICVDKQAADPINDPNTIASATKRTKRCPGAPFECVHGHCENGETEAGDASAWCVCDKGWTNEKCEYPCTLDCVHGSCVVFPPNGVYIAPENVTESLMDCNCKLGWQGALCQEKTPDLVEETKERMLRLGLGLGITLFGVLVVSVIVLTVLWRKRVIVVMKLVYFFKVAENDDDRSYDAYISMGTSRRGIEFVKNKLCPMLSDHGFNAYVQERDLLAGEVLCESIHNAMEQSRRTILIITPDYLRNEWSQFECLIAQIETLKLHQRIIPIVLEDISAEKQNMNKTLKHILASVKCLKFPSAKSNESVSLKEWKRKEERFWKRLQLTMPKKAKCNYKEPETEISQLDEFHSRDERPIDIKTISVMYNAV